MIAHPILDAQRAIVGALVRGSLVPADLAELPLGWWAIESPSLWARGLAELHGRLVVACAMSVAEAGRVDLPLVFTRLAPWYAGELREGRAVGYLPELARCAPKRPAALRALGVVVWEVERRRQAEGALGLRATAEALVRVDRLAEEAEARRRRVLPGLLAAIAEAGV